MTMGNEQPNFSGFGFHHMTQRLVVALIKLIYATIVENVHR